MSRTRMRGSSEPMRVLEDQLQPHAQKPQAALGQPRDLDPVDLHRSRRGLVKPGDDPQQGRLAAPGLADDPEPGAARDIESSRPAAHGRREPAASGRSADDGSPARRPAPGSPGLGSRHRWSRADHHGMVARRSPVPGWCRSTAAGSGTRASRGCTGCERHTPRGSRPPRAPSPGSCTAARRLG